MEDKHAEREESVKGGVKQRAGRRWSRTVMRRDSLTELGHSYWKPSSKRVKAPGKSRSGKTHDKHPAARSVTVGETLKPRGTAEIGLHNQLRGCFEVATMSQILVDAKLWRRQDQRLALLSQHSNGAKLLDSC